VWCHRSAGNWHCAVGRLHCVSSLFSTPVYCHDMTFCMCPYHLRVPPTTITRDNNYIIKTSSQVSNHKRFSLIIMLNSQLPRHEMHLLAVVKLGTNVAPQNTNSQLEGLQKPNLKRPNVRASYRTSACGRQLLCCF